MRNKIKIAAMGDLHINEDLGNHYKKLFAEINKRADYFVICGDITQRGTESEIDTFIKSLGKCKIPVITVLGNHDFEAGEQTLLINKLKKHKIIVLDGEEPYTNKEVGFAGVKGFCGGFEVYMLQLWGESVIKQFYYEGVNESQKLENALAKLQTKFKVVVLHYSPIRATVTGESPEIFTYLGSSRLEIPINRFKPDVVFHGHAHHGTEEGKTSEGIPVYNVSYPLMEHISPKQPYRIIEL